MGLPIERWARQATMLDAPPKPVLADIDELKHYQRQFWLRKNRELWADGGPVALQGGFAGLPVVPLPAAITAIASLNGTCALWTSSLYTPVNANAIQAPSAWRIAAWGTSTTSTSPGNLGWDPRVGAGSTGGSAISGTTLGASTNVALTASITSAFWAVMGDITIRNVQGAGANSVVIGFFSYTGTQATSSGLAGPAAVGAGHNLQFGGSTASIDLSVASGFSLGAVNTVTTITYTVQQIHWLSLN